MEESRRERPRGSCDGALASHHVCTVCVCVCVCGTQRALVHFVGFAARHDVWLPVDSSRELPTRHASRATRLDGEHVLCFMPFAFVATRPAGAALTCPDVEAGGGGIDSHSTDAVKGPRAPATDTGGAVSRHPAQGRLTTECFYHLFCARVSRSETDHAASKRAAPSLLQQRADRQDRRHGRGFANVRAMQILEQRRRLRAFMQHPLSSLSLSQTPISVVMYWPGSAACAEPREAQACTARMARGSGACGSLRHVSRLFC